jgi:polyhydroxybutyrate depolymerase
MWHTAKGKYSTWYMAACGALVLLIGSARPATSQAVDEESSGSITTPLLGAEMGHSIPRSINVGGVTRTYLLYVPHTFKAKRSGLIIGLHGRGPGGPGSAMEHYSQLDSKADQEGFAVAYLDGLVDSTGTLNWNYYYDFFFKSGPDDVGFIRGVIDRLQEQLRPNPRRIYVVGISAGGFMAQRVGVELSERVAAIGVVEGELYLLSPDFPPTIPNPAAPISVLFLKGDQDPNN